MVGNVINSLTKAINESRWRMSASEEGDSDGSIALQESKPELK